MQYNQAGGITFKNSNGSGFMNASALTYNLEYTYNSVKTHQLDQVWDPTNGILTKFTYNTTGSVTKIDDSSQPVVQDFFWNEQQQLTGVSNQQGVHHYVYDHSGERIMKSSLINSTVYLNDQVIDNASNLDPYTVYVNPFYVVTGFQGGDRVSKHYYMNQQRVATDISINYDPSSKGGSQQEQLSAKGTSSSETAWSPALTDFNEVLVGLGQKSLDTASLKLPTLASYYPEAAKTPATSSSAEGNPSAPRILFWYHPDYLGNVDLITERDGYTHEFFMYNPWGEEMHQWNANTYAFTSPYRFNAKELDPETGLAYYGARYYQNKLGVWLSVDPLAMDTKQVGITSYGFGWNNPLSFVDPTGLMPEDAELGGLALPDQVKAKSASAPIIYVTFRDLPNGMDKESFMISLRQNLISNGVSENLVVKDSKDKGFFEGISNWINEVPTASLLIKKYNIRSDGHPEKGGYAIRNDPNSPIIFTGLSPKRSDQFLSENQYVRAAMHELGHGIWGFSHNKDGKAPDPNSCMDYKYSGLNYSEDEKKKIRASAWGN